MFPLEVWKQKIVKYFVVKSYPRVYRATSVEEIFATFGSNIDSNTEIALNELIEDGILLRVKSNQKIFYLLNFIEKMDEIRYIIRSENLDNKAGMIQPDKKETEGLKFQFHTTSERGWPNRGIYFYYVRKDDPDFWMVLNKTRPNVKPYKIILYSLKDPNSKISRIWKATVKVYKKNKYKPFFRKQVEDEDQQACDNTRLGSKAAFDIFVHKRWLKISGRRGRMTFYEIPSLKPKSEVDAEKKEGRVERI